jgi:hypothetical protein
MYRRGICLMEMALVLAILVRDWDFELSPGRQIRPKPAMTLRSDCPIEMNLLKVPEPASSPSLDSGTIRPTEPPPRSS